MTHTFIYAGISYTLTFKDPKEAALLLWEAVQKKMKQSFGKTLPESKFRLVRETAERSLGLQAWGSNLPKKLGFVEMAKGSYELFKIAAGDKAPVEEVLRRVSICTTCPLRSNTSENCLSCSAGSAVITMKTKFAPLYNAAIQPVKNQYCRACGCSLVALTQVSDLSSVPKAIDKWEGCWQNE